MLDLKPVSDVVRVGVTEPPHPLQIIKDVREESDTVDLGARAGSLHLELVEVEVAAIEH